jgi:hypothetical protein
MADGNVVLMPGGRQVTLFRSKKKDLSEEVDGILNRIAVIAKRAEKANAQEETLKKSKALESPNPLAYPTINHEMHGVSQATTDNGQSGPDQSTEWSTPPTPVAKKQEPTHNSNSQTLTPGGEF